MFQFGVGGLFGNPNGGNASSPSWPQRFGTIQNVDLEISQKLQSLYGQNKFPDDVAPSDMKITGKGGFANIEIAIYNALFYGETTASGISAVSADESHAIASSVTITPPNSGTYSLDLGVRNGTTGAPLIRSSSGPASGYYTVASNVYSFNATDVSSGFPVLISYAYTLTTGTTLTVTNHIQGYGPTFELWLLEPYQGTNGIHLYQCRASKMSNPLKRDNYVISDFEFEAYANAAGKVVDFFQISA
jgi:hypothetical protein